MEKNKTKMVRRITAKAGNVLIGGTNPIVVQTMCNTHTSDIEASTAQCIRCTEAGARLIRLTTPSLCDVEALAEIKARLRAKGIDTPLVADIHFRSDVAMEAAKVAEKVRINPGNFHKDPQKAREEFARLLGICKEYGTAVRIGVNHGSLGAGITEKYGNTAEGMARAAMEWLRMCMDNDFWNVVVSLKSSNVLVMVQAYRILQEFMVESGVIFPLHLGVTEAGNGDAARIKSAVGISALLADGMGDTVRVSLTEEPEAEIPVGEYIASKYRFSKEGPIMLGEWERHIIDVSCKFGKDLLDRKIDTFNEPSAFGPEKDDYLLNELLQACRRKFYRPEYVACPGCGRTMYDLQEVFGEVKRRTAHLGNVCIAVMGCIVNGPGEMADADYGYVGEGRGLVSIYKGKTPVFRHVPQEDAIDMLLHLIERENSKQ